MGLKLGPLNLVVLSSYEPVKEWRLSCSHEETTSRLTCARLLDKRGNIYSSRPPTYVATELATPKDAHILFTPYGPAWRKLRKGSVGLLNVTQMDELLPLQCAESTQTMFDIMKSPGDWYSQLQRYASAVILEAVFGVRGATADNPLMTTFYELSHDFTGLLALGATPPVDAFPFLTRVPEFLTPYVVRAKNLRTKKSNFYKTLVEESRVRMGKPNAAPCFMHELLAKGDKSGLTYEQLCYVGGTFVRGIKSYSAIAS
jgi:cytochrome P450